MGKRKATTPLEAMERALVGRIGRGSAADIARQVEAQSASLSQVEKHQLIQMLEKKIHKGVDINYIRTVLFPEVYSYDIPQPMSNLSYCRFTDKQEAVITTGGQNNLSNGCGLVVWYPKVTVGPSLFYYRCTESGQLPTTSKGIALIDAVQHTTPPTVPAKLDQAYVLETGAWSNGTEIPDQQWTTGFYKNYEPSFTQTALVAASISVQFIGEVDKECGMMVGGHIYGQGIDTLSVEDIENSQFVTRARPSEGLRFTYLPMESTDYEYYPTKRDNSHNSGSQPVGDEQFFRLRRSYYTRYGETPVDYQITTKQLNGEPMPTGGDWTGIDEIAYSNSTQYIAFYWKGLPGAKDWLRIDATRKFNAVPKAKVRDIVEVSRAAKNFDSKKTFDVLRNLCINAPIGGHTLKDLDKTQDRIQAAIPNIVADGMSDRVDSLQSLSDLAGTLELPTAMDKGLVGSGGTMLGRVYPFDV